ncbi:MAG TPA: hypothetical protein VEA59_06200 [Patescibacteria group bacterium]|nr:hypothetical protein [Patescibacteria group bacterium]
MAKVVFVPAGERFGKETIIRSQFEKAGVPDFWVIAPEIDRALLDRTAPAENFMLVIYDEVPQFALTFGKVRQPTLEEVLWATGFMNTSLATQVGKSPIRFQHQPLIPLGTWQGSDYFRQIVVKRAGKGYTLETVAANKPYPNERFVYVLP